MALLPTSYDVGIAARSLRYSRTTVERAVKHQSHKVYYHSSKSLSDEQHYGLEDNNGSFRLGQTPYSSEIHSDQRTVEHHIKEYLSPAVVVRSRNRDESIPSQDTALKKCKRRDQYHVSSAQPMAYTRRILTTSVRPHVSEAMINQYHHSLRNFTTILSVRVACSQLTRPRSSPRTFIVANRISERLQKPLRRLSQKSPPGNGKKSPPANDKKSPPANDKKPPATNDKNSPPKNGKRLLPGRDMKLPTRSGTKSPPGHATNSKLKLPLSPKDDDMREKQKREAEAEKKQADEKEQQEARTERADKALKSYNKAEESADRFLHYLSVIHTELKLLYQGVLVSLADEIEFRQERILVLLEHCWQSYFKKSLIKACWDRIEDIEQNMSNFDKEHTAILQTSNDTTAKLCLAAKHLSSMHQELKSDRGQHDRFSKIAATVADGSSEIGENLESHLLRKVEFEMITKGIWRPLDALGLPVSANRAANIHLRDRSVFEMVDRSKDPTALVIFKIADLRSSFTHGITTESVGLHHESHELKSLAHMYRNLDLQVRMQKIVPEINFARYWSAVYLYTYAAPWEFVDLQLKIILKDERKQWNSIKKRQSQDLKRLRLQRGSTKRDLQTFSRFSTKLNQLLVSATVFTHKTSDILYHYRGLIDGGLSTLCFAFHPQKQLYSWQCDVFHSFDVFRVSHMKFVESCKIVLGDLEDHRIQEQRHASPQSFEAHKRFHSAVLSSAQDQTRWRREFRQCLTDVFVWSSTRVLSTARLGPDIKAEAVVANRSITLPETRKLNGNSLNENTPWKPEAWLTMQSLYTGQTQVFVDMVASLDGLYLAIPELRESQVVGVKTLKRYVHGAEIEYFLFATEKQVLIVDWVGFVANERGLARALLRTILEDESILKVAFQCDEEARFIWNTAWMNMSSYVTPLMTDMSSFVRNYFPSIADQNIPGVRKSRVRDLSSRTDPGSFFHELACQPYAALRAFHLLQKQDVVVSLPFGKQINISQTQAVVRKAVQSREDPTLGPVFIDRAESSYSRTQMSSVRAQYARSRIDWLHQLGRAMADVHRKELSEPRSALPDTDPSSLSQAHDAVAAYYLLTAFHENLTTIAACFNMVDVRACAAWILEAVERENLFLRDDDRHQLELASDKRRIDDSVGDQEKEVSNVPTVRRVPAGINPADHGKPAGYQGRKQSHVLRAPRQTPMRKPPQVVIWKPFDKNKMTVTDHVLRLSTTGMGITRPREPKEFRVRKTIGSTKPSSKDNCALDQKKGPGKKTRDRAKKRRAKALGQGLPAHES